MLNDPGIPLVQQPPTRIVPSGTITLLAGGTQVFSGSNSRQDRIQFIITNLDAASSLKLQSSSGINFLTVFATRSITLLTTADIQVQNPNGVSVDFEVCELFPDTGNLARSRTVALAAAGANGSGANGGGTGGGGGGGYTGGGGRQSQPA